MKLRNASMFRPVLAVLAITMLVVALACASEDPTPTSPPATSPPPTATSAPVDGAQPTEAPVADGEMDVDWMEQYLQSPGYDPAWGQPVRGGTFVFGANRDGTTFNLGTRVAAATDTAATPGWPPTVCSALTLGQGTSRQ